MISSKAVVFTCLAVLCCGGSPVFGYPAATSLANSNTANQVLVGGDMIIPLTRGVAQSGNRARWTNGIVPYVMSNDFTLAQQALITGAMRRIEKETDINNRRCVHFRPKAANDQYSILIKTGSGCSSHVGQNTGWFGQLELTLQVPSSQQVSHCMHEGTIMHELMHALGFEHEHQRPDRDLYLTINFANVQSGYAFAFDKYTSTVDTQGTAYDYNSIMHYDRTAFSSNGKPTMVPKDLAAVIGDKDHLSPIDIQEIRMFYKCQ